jgi:protoheme IX farnesyltransferase
MATEPMLAALDAAVAPRSYVDRSGVLSDFWMLTKPEINFLIAITTGAAFCLGRPAAAGYFAWALLLHTVLGTVLVASGASTLNQLIERRFDAQMRRTARRPIASGRIDPLHALIFGTLLSGTGAVYLGLAVRPAASLLALLTLGAYLFLYTPLKRRTPLCTFIGAIPGAMPVVIGYVAATGQVRLEAWLLYGILFLWQFPHFMAIAWMYREDYARACYKVLPPGNENLWWLRCQSVLPAVVLIPITVVPVILRRVNPMLSAGTLLLDLGFAYYALSLAFDRSNRSARRLLLASIVYLPTVFVLEFLAHR